MKFREIPAGTTFKEGDVVYGKLTHNRFVVHSEIRSSKGIKCIILEGAHGDLKALTAGEVTGSYFMEAIHDLVEGDVFTILEPHLDGVLFLYVSDRKVIRFGESEQFFGLISFGSLAAYLRGPARPEAADHTKIMKLRSLKSLGIELK